MRILVTGSRNHPDYAIVRNILRTYVNAYNWNTIVIHGDCPTGVDKYVKDFCNSYNVKMEEYPAQWDIYGKSAGPKRNQKMVDSGADICLAFPYKNSKGTKDCVKRAIKAGIKTIEIELHDN